MVRNGRSVGSAREEAGEGGCYMCSVEELEMRLEDWIWRNEGEVRIYRSPISFPSRSFPF